MSIINVAGVWTVTATINFNGIKYYLYRSDKNKQCVINNMFVLISSIT